MKNCIVVIKLLINDNKKVIVSQNMRTFPVTSIFFLTIPISLLLPLPHSERETDMRKRSEINGQGEEKRIEVEWNNEREEGDERVERRGDRDGEIVRK